MKNFFFIALLALAFCGCQNNNKSQQPSEADIEAMVNERVAAKLAEQGVEATSNSSVSNTNSSVSASNNTAEASDGKTQYAYEFVVSGTTYRLSLDLEEESAQLYVEGAFAPNGKTFYGTCKREYDKKWVIQSGGFDGTNDYDITLNGKRTWWDVFQWIDTKNNYIYLNGDAYRAKNPDYRIAIKPIK